MRLARLLAILTALAALTVRPHAQQMPDPAQMAGRPLPAPELATGTVSVRVVRERMGNDVPDEMVTLQAPGRSLEARTDRQGRAQFADVPPGTQVTVHAVVDGEPLQSQPFTVPASGGVRVALIAGLEAAAARERAEAEAGAKMPARPGIVVFGGETRIILEFQNDNLHVFYLLDIVNNARTPIDVGEPLVIELPDGASGAGAMQGSSTLATVQGDRIRITGPFPPGVTQVQVGYRLAYSGNAATVTQRWPVAIEQLFVAAEKVGGLQISSPQFSQQQEANAGGAPFIMATGGRIAAGDALTLSLSGLPARSLAMRNVGIGVGLLVLAVGFWAAFSAGTAARQQTQALHARREKLFASLVALEEQHRRQRLDERRYATRRQSLVAQIERVMAEIDRAESGVSRGGAPGGGEDVAA